MLCEPQLFLSSYQKMSNLTLILFDTPSPYLLVPIAALSMLQSIHCWSAAADHFFIQPTAIVSQQAPKIITALQLVEIQTTKWNSMQHTQLNATKGNQPVRYQIQPIGLKTQMEDAVAVQR